MATHLLRINQWVVYAGLSCAAAFFTRLLPAFTIPMLFLRISILLYVLRSTAPDRSFLLVTALLAGWLGGYIDILEVWLRWNSGAAISGVFSIGLALLFIRGVIHANRQTSS